MPRNVPVARAEGPPTGIDAKKLPGIVADDVDAETSGKWTPGTGLKGYVGYGYLYAPGDSGATIQFSCRAPKAGRYEVRLAYREHENRATSAPVTLVTGSLEKSVEVNMRKAPTLPNGFVSLGTLDLEAGQVVQVKVATKGAGGMVHADAVQLLPLQ